MGNKTTGEGTPPRRQWRSGPGAALTVAGTALFTDALLYGIAVPVLPQLATDDGTGTLGVGALFAVYAAALVAVTPIAGRWIDRRGNREPMIVGLLGLAAATLLFAFAAGPAMLFLARGLQGVAAGLSWTASLAFIAATHSPDRRGPAMGMALSAFGFGTLAGPLVGGFLAEWLGTRAPFFVALAVALVDGLLRWWLIPRESGQARRRPASASLRGLAGVSLVGLLTVVGAMLLAYLEPILPLHLHATAGAGPGVIGVVFGVAAAIAAGAPPLIGLAARRLPARTIAAAGCAVAAAGFVGIGLTTGAVWAAVFLTVVAIGAAAVLTPTLTVMADIAEARRPPAYGAVYALYTLAYTAGLAVAPVTAGAAAAAWEFRGAALAGTALAAAAVVAIAANSGARGGRPAPAPPSGVDSRRP